MYAMYFERKRTKQHFASLQTRDNVTVQYGQTVKRRLESLKSNMAAILPRWR